MVACGSNVAPAALPPAPAKAPTPPALSIPGAPDPPPLPTPLPPPPQDNQQGLTFSAADVKGEPWFAIDEALHADPGITMAVYGQPLRFLNMICND